MTSKVYQRPRSEAYDHLAAWFPTYVNEHGDLPTYNAALNYLKAVHNLGASSTTVRRAFESWNAVPANQELLAAARERRREQFLPAAGPATNDGNPSLASPSGGIAAGDPLFAAAFQALKTSIRDEERARADKDAEARIAAAQATADEAVRVAKLSEQRAGLFLEQAEAARVAAEAQATERIRDADSRVSEARLQLEKLATEHAQHRAVDREEYRRDAIAQAQALAEPLRAEIAGLQEQLRAREADLQTAAAQQQALQAQLLESEQRASAQHSELTRFWAAEVSRGRVELEQTQAALRRAVAEKEDAVRAARSEATQAIVAALNGLREAVGGVNTVHNTHLGDISRRLEELEKRIVRWATAKPKQPSTPRHLPPAETSGSAQ